MAAAIFPTGTEHAPEITRQLTTRFADEFGYAVDDLLLYRAAYAMAAPQPTRTKGTPGSA
ncbi:hypothetical protein ACF1AB_28250 [Streptomyces sp. NPDC014846]|uniref:hypothetical protein n=1 Tax=Streptomyces sp. NPDC014846 TaxID=3364922 RepID=UPI0036F9D0C5